MLRSVRSIVIPPARTGRERRRRMAVIKTAQTNKGIRSIRNPSTRMLRTVVMKFSAPKMDETPARCKEKIARSTEGPAWARFADRGGYTVQPVPTPFSTAAENTRRVKEGGRSQKLILFRRGNAISGAASIKGRSQLPNPPMKTGITKKKIIKNAWAVTRVLYSWSLPSKEPGWPNSARIRSLIDVPKRPDQIPKIKYKVPISL